MKENVSMVTAVLAIIISIVAITSAVVIKPVSTIGADTIGENELADNSVTSRKVADNTLTDEDIADTGISKIADDSITSDQIVSNSIMLQDLNLEVVTAMTGVADIANDSIASEKIANGTITNEDISDSADIDPSKILGTAWTAGNDGSGSGLDADTVDDIEGNQFLRNDVSGTLNGDLTVNGNVSVDKVVYSTPRTHYYSIGGEHFYPNSNIDYQHFSGLGGAYILSGSGNLVAPVNLPNEAIVTSVEAFFDDTSAEDMDVFLYRHNLDGPGYAGMSYILSDADTGYYNRTDTTIVGPIIDNQEYSYFVRVKSDNWSSSLRIKGIVITYTTDEAE